MPQYYHPSIAPAIKPGTRETAAIGSGAKTHKRGELHNPREYNNAGQIVSRETKILHTDAPPTVVARRVAVWAVFNGVGRRIRHFGYSERFAADATAAGAAVGNQPGYVLKEIIG